MAGSLLAASCMVLVVLWLVGDDDQPVVGGTDGVVVDRTPSVLDEVFPDRATAPATEPTPTANPAGAADAADQLVTTEAMWDGNVFGEADVVVLLTNTSDTGLANVAVTVIAVDADGVEVGRAESALARVEPSQVVPVATQFAIDADSISSVVVQTAARGTLPPGAPGEVSDVDWSVDDTGTVVVSGSFTPEMFAEFVAIVAVMRDADGVFVGFAFGLLDSVDAEGRVFEATGFPSADVADVEVFATA